jgi:hypothetical protein
MTAGRIFGVVAFAVPVLIFALNRASLANGDELAWRTLVDITDTNKPTPPGQSAAGWRFWYSREKLFPQDRSHPIIPASADFARYRDLACDTPALVEFFEEVKKLEHKPLDSNRSQVDEFCELIYLNPAYARTVIDRGLYWRDGLIAYLFSSGNYKLELPSETREIKTEWKRLGPRDSESNFIIARNEKTHTRYALVALHLRSRQLPNSLWATWIHQDFLDRLGAYPITDSFGKTGAAYPSRELTTLLTNHSQRIWLEYRLIGTQIDFGNRKSLGNPLIEGKVFQDLNNSSCMSCHRQAAIKSFGGWTTPLPGVGQEINPPKTLKPTDFSWPLVRAPICKSYMDPKCNENLDLDRIKTSRAKAIAP